MIHKFLFSFLLTTTLLTSLDSCFAMDPDQDNDPEISSALKRKEEHEENIKLFQQQIKDLPEDFTNFPLEAQSLRKQMFEIQKNILEKQITDEKTFINKNNNIISNRKFINIMKISLGIRAEINSKKYKETREDGKKIISLIESALKDEPCSHHTDLCKLQAQHMLIQGLALDDLIDYVDTDFKLLNFQDVKDALHHIQKGLEYSKQIEIKDKDFLRLQDRSKERLKNVADILTLKINCLPADNSFESLDKCYTNLCLHSQLLNMESVPNTQNPTHLKLLMVIMDFSGRIYRNTLPLNIKNSIPTFKEINKLKSTAQILGDTALFLKQHLITPQLNGIFVAYDKSREIISNECDHSPQGLNAVMLFQLLYKSFCKSQKMLSNAFLNLETSNENLKKAYSSKSDEHLQLASQAYKENVCSPNLQNNEHFVHASLEALIGNEQPLKDFYAELRLERKQRREAAIAQAIRTQQAETKEHEKKLRKDESDQRKAGKKINIESEVLVSSSSIEPMVEPTSGREEIKETFKKEKIKTRNPADPARAKSQPKKVLPVENVAHDNTIHFISPDSHEVFLVLIGESLQRNVSLSQVKTLLKELNCTIKKAKTGSHGKATDPKTQSMWTIPPAWNGPIPPFYRLQLMEFLLESMEIDPEDVQPKER